jgi:5-(carboxyamino)imidazole ribonucleotide synthase
MSKVYLPGETWIGVLGGGQLGRMLTFEALRMGYSVISWIGGPDSGPSGPANEVIEEPFDSEAGLARFLERADVVTVEFENIPAALLEAVAEKLPMSPPPFAVITSQHREREKTFLSKHGFPCAPFSIVDSAEALAVALKNLPDNGGILKTAEFGYDGKGQLPVNRKDDAEARWIEFGAPRGVLENKIQLASEISVMVVRDHRGNCVCYDPAENFHTRHILDVSIVPARLPDEVQKEARDCAMEVANALGYTGVMAVEFFIDETGKLLVNEIAPRPHNSGHHTINACDTSQFAQQLRVLCGLPIGSPRTIQPAVMWNLLGDIWPEDGNSPDWTPILEIEGAYLHLYGKHHARRGRKMGHVTFVADSREQALDNAMKCRALFGIEGVLNS